MFFRRTATPASAASATATPPDNESIDLAPLLDAFGQVLSAYAHGSFDLPGRSAHEAMLELDQWRRHAMLGAPVDGETVAVANGGIAARDFGGAARAFADSRRIEKRLVESALTDLRDCLWTCVQRVHVAVQADLHAESATALQVERLQSTIQRLETGAIRDELMETILQIEHIAESRRETQRQSFALLAERIDELSTQLADARRESETDVLTGLGNRKRFEQAVARAMQLSTIGGAPVSLVSMDLDNLKLINDRGGHAAGDAALQTFATCLSKVFLGEADVLCRVGGDEFMALLPHARLPLAERLSHRLVQTVDAIAAGDEPALSVSVGYAEVRRGEDVGAWLARADAALYEAKTSGRGQAIAAA